MAGGQNTAPEIWEGHRAGRQQPPEAITGKGRAGEGEAGAGATGPPGEALGTGRGAGLQDLGWRGPC